MQCGAPYQHIASLLLLSTARGWETGLDNQELNKELKDRITNACKCFSPFINGGTDNDPYISINVGDTSNDLEHSINVGDPNHSIAPNCDERHILECLYNYVVPKNVVEIDYQNRNMENYKIFHLFRQLASGFLYLLHPKSPSISNKNLPSAAELHRRGVKFTVFTWASEEIRFDRSSSTLFLPCIGMEYRTDVFLRNMVVVEAFMTCKTRVFTCYADLMDKLIDTPDDVAVVKRYGIICNDLGSDKEISILWNGIRRSVWRSEYEPIDKTMKDVNTYYRSRYGVFLGEFFQEHFSNPWRAASVVGALVLLVLAVLQTVFSYYQMPHNRKQL